MKIEDNRGVQASEKYQHKLGDIVCNYITSQKKYFLVVKKNNGFGFVNLNESDANCYEYKTLEEMTKDNPHDVKLNAKLVIER